MPVTGQASQHQDEQLLIDNIKTANTTVSPRMFSIGNIVPYVSTDFNNSTPVNTEFYYGEVFVPCSVLVTGVAVFNGTDVTDNIKVGIADSTGAILGTSVSTAGAGADAFQLVPLSAALTLTGPATYFILTMYAAGTSRYNSPILGSFATGKVTGQVFATGFTAFTPATTFTTNLAAVAGLY